MSPLFLAMLLLAPQDQRQPVLASAEAASPSSPLSGTDGATAADDDDQEQICRTSSVQRSGLISRSRKICRTKEQWRKAALAR